MLQMKLNQAFGLSVVGVLLGVVGTYLIFAPATSQQPAKAQMNYETNWQAARLLQVVLSFSGGSNPSFYPGGAGTINGPYIGVSTWKVTGTVGDTSFQESWEIPEVNGFEFKQIGDSVLERRVCSIIYPNPGGGQSDWLAGCWTGAGHSTGYPAIQKYVYRLRQVAIEAATDASVQQWQGNMTQEGLKAAGRAISCFRAVIGGRDLPECLSTTGPYSIVHEFGPHFGGEDDVDRTYGRLVAMPLRWKVTGTISN